jgi:hypothetical protein
MLRSEDCKLKSAVASLVLVCAVGIYGCGERGGNGVTGPSNRSPVIRAQADTSVSVGDTLVIWADAHDADGDDLVFTATAYISYEEFRRGYFPDAGMNAETGRFAFRTRSEDGPARRFAFSVEDGCGGEDSTSFWVTLE